MGEWIEAAADVIENVFLTTLLLPGIGTIAELDRAQRADPSDALTDGRGA